jgi:PAS domain S-box-containing protein
MRKFRELLGNIRLLSLMLDSNGHIFYLNDYACNLLGYTYQEVLGKNWINNFVPDSDMQMKMHKQFKETPFQQVLKDLLFRNPEEKD